VLRRELFEKIGREYTEDDFEDLCFQFGVELEHGSAEEMQMTRVDGNGTNVDLSTEYVYKIEVAANRYDLLCVEGIASAFRVYLGSESLPRFTIKNQSDNLQEIIVKAETAVVRPCVVGCVLRDIRFDIASYNSFIDL
jgi:phenylalanyl-tRNA synthetase beta chain